MEINGGNTFVWLQGNGTASNIVMANRNPDGTWGPAVDPGPGINDHSAGVLQDNPHLSADGKTLWFTSNRPMGLGGRDIWSSSNSNGSWSAPVNVGAPINSAADDDQFWFSAASPDLYWNHPGQIMHCVSAGSKLAHRSALPQSGVPPAGLTLIVLEIELASPFASVTVSVAVKVPAG